MKEIRHSLKWVLIWMCLAAVCCVIIWLTRGQRYGLEFIAGYLIELSLSVDNLFVFLTIFMSFGLDEAAQHRVLNWGIIGAICLRFLFIFFGLGLVSMFHWILYIFGAILIYNGIKMFSGKNEKIKTEDSLIVRVVSRILPMTKDFREHYFMVRENGKHLFTPLFAVMCLIEGSDIIFAIDSVPAVFSVSTDLIVVYTSNIFAILGLRQLFFVLEHIANRFEYVKYGVGLLLIFTGLKLLLLIFDIEISTQASIAIILSVLVVSVIASVIISRVKGRGAGHGNGDEDAEHADTQADAKVDAATGVAQKDSDHADARADISHVDVAADVDGKSPEDAVKNPADAGDKA